MGFTGYFLRNRKPTEEIECFALRKRLRMNVKVPTARLRMDGLELNLCISLFVLSNRELVLFLEITVECLGTRSYEVRIDLVELVFSPGGY
eukprot:m.238252 g.238252  ORF g.238252 m.238252 type:complete len:91 (-) comp26564_c4_seq11:83-355(-)